MALICLQAVKELGLADQIPHSVRASFGTIFASFTSFKDVRAQVYANRGVSVVSTATRVRPNAFHFRRQVIILQRAGGGNAERQSSEWSQSTTIARAFSIGAKEAEAVSNLMCKVPATVVETLCAAVRVRGMARFLSHEAIAKSVFNTGWSSGMVACEAWKDQLTNKEDCRLVDLFVSRILGDWDKTAAPLRKALAYKDAVALRQATGAFLHFVAVLQSSFPAKDFKDASDSLLAQFMEGFLDPDLIHAMSVQVPPGDIRAVGAFRPFLAKMEAAVRSERELRDAELAENLRRADLQQLVAKLERDFKVLEGRKPKEDASAKERALDMKYLRERQTQGNEHVERWMAQNCQLVKVDDTLESAAPQFLKFKEQFRGKGEEYLICVMDFTVFPANASYVAAALKTFAALLSMTSNAVGLVMYPVWQTQTSESALVKHRQLLDNAFLKAGLSMKNLVQLLYTKPDSPARDARSLSQLGLATFHSHFDSHAFANCKPVREGKLGPCPLIKISEFVGYDLEVSKPGASARVEQKGPACYDAIVNSFLDGMSFQDSDILLFVDVVPNRFAEFARAIAARDLNGSGRTVHYFGFVHDEFTVNSAAIRNMVYKEWDANPDSPPKQRVRPETVADTTPDLEMLAWSGNAPNFPDALLTRFPENSDEYRKVHDLRQRFKEQFPTASQPSAADGRGGRVGGLCDYSIDGGKEPLDVRRQIDLPAVAVGDMTLARKAGCDGSGKKPAITVDENYHIWLGNLTDADVTLEAGELFGFGRGAYEQKEVRRNLRNHFCTPDNKEKVQ
ncbi:unnamed protein product [Durusdinium trenchii]|uniref:Uncharacterized protein n=2 Tax=Durusdinium trenchii TaxID=1381693 RepID=A0ABP0LAL2_9DINO